MAIPEMRTITMPDENGNDETYEIVDQKNRESIANLSEEIADHEGDANKHITSDERTAWNNKSNFSGSYDDLTNKPVIPSTTSELTNDSGYLTAVPSEYVTQTELTAKRYLTSIPSEYVTDSELTAKGYASQTSVTQLSEEIEELKAGGGGGGGASSLTDLGITATADELNFVKGVTSSIQTQLNGKAASNHNHDTIYSKLGHTHTEYASSNHNHDSVYSKLGHAHSEYALASHSHSGYAASNHNHDTVYSKLGHTHTEYAPASHSHSNYVDLTSAQTITGTKTFSRINAANGYLTGSLYVGGKTASTDGHNGVAFGASGSVFMQGANPTVNFLQEGKGGTIGAKIFINTPTDGFNYLKFKADNKYLVFRQAPSSDTNATAYFYGEDDGKTSLGGASFKWYRVYAANSAISTSDKRQKKNIKPLKDVKKEHKKPNGKIEDADIYGKLFDMLEPTEYNFIEGDDKKNFGLIAQDVLESMIELGIGEDELDLVHHDTWIDEKTGEEKDAYGIAYENLIPLLIYEVQKLKGKDTF